MPARLGERHRDRDQTSRCRNPRLGGRRWGTLLPPQPNLGLAPSSKQKGLPQDKGAAEQALSDLDRVIAGKSDLSAVGVTIPNAQYYSGLIAWNQFHSDSRAYSYWKLCADSAHAGCMLRLLSQSQPFLAVASVSPAHTYTAQFL